MPSFFHSQSVHVWISANEPMPNVCCHCGMFTDNRISVRHVELVREAVSGDSCGTVIVAIAMHLFLGPLGWLLALFFHGNTGEDGMKTVKKKTKVKISQCLICKSVLEPEVVESRSPPPQFLFLVHPRFKDCLDQERAASAESDD